MTRNKEWQPQLWIGPRSIGPNVPPWKVSPASTARRGFSEERTTPVSMVFENLQDMNVDELVEEFGVTRERIRAVLQFVADAAESPNYGTDVGSFP